MQTTTIRNIIYDHLTKEPFEITATITLVGTGVTGSDNWVHDAWHVRLALRPDYGRGMTMDYRTGIGHREKYLGHSDPQPHAPEIKSVLWSVGTDYQTARDLPGDEAEACDHLASEFGYERPGQTLRVVRALQSQASNLREFLKGTGIDADHFADWCAGLEA